jgi:hypothetical protein
MHETSENGCHVYSPPTLTTPQIEKNKPYHRIYIFYIQALQYEPGVLASVACSTSTVAPPQAALVLVPVSGFQQYS